MATSLISAKTPQCIWDKAPIPARDLKTSQMEPKVLFLDFFIALSFTKCSPFLPKHVFLISVFLLYMRTSPQAMQHSDSVRFRNDGRYAFLLSSGEKVNVKGKLGKRTRMTSNSG